ncbi:MAG: sugar ABC transporter permease [Anaerolineae bacterium]|nr:sugar ABC transporter permease [Anaerolineae bacterium]
MSRLSSQARREELTAYLCISPWLIGILLFTAGPLIASLVISFTKWPLLAPPKWIGLDNYARLLTDGNFWQSLKVTGYYSGVGIPAGLLAGFSIALLMNQKIKGIRVWRTIYYLPAVISGVAVARLWQWVFNGEYGIINVALSWIGINGPYWLRSEQWVIPALLIMAMWGVAGANMVIYLAGLQSIPTELYEAAMIDGANGWHKLIYITIPMMSPIIFLRLVMGIIGSFQVFTPAFVMTDGGPGQASLFYVLYLYRNAFEYNKMGYACALAWVLFVIILLLTALVFRSSEAWVFYQGKGRQ